MTMTITDLDRDLERYRSAADAVSMNLTELDGDPNRLLLETAPLTGETAREWADARAALASVWDWFARFTTFLDRAVELRSSPRTRLAPHRERQLADFLTGASIELRSDEIPLRDRGLLQPRRTATHCTADELLELMATAFARAREVVSRVGTAWDELVPRIAHARATLDDAGAIEHPEVTAEVDSLAEALVTDPLRVTEAAVRDLEASVAAATRASAAARALRDQWPERLHEARGELTGVEQRLAGARDAHATTTAKILDVALPDPPTGGGLADELDEVVALATAERWDAALAALEQWRQHVRARAEAADASAAASRAPMVERDHLRGLLDACRAKAHARHLDEDATATAAYEQAQDALYVAPADLAEARRLVERYRRLLSTDPEAEARR